MGSLLQLTGLIKPAAIVIIVIGLVTYRAILVHERDAARSQAAAFQAEFAAAQAANQSLSAEIARQNFQTEALQRQAKAAADSLKTRNQQAAAASASLMNQEIARANAIAAQPIADGCAAAIEWGNGAGPELGKW
jgi:septal ring factor EnvC (AmiA/AmiB activator)